MMTHAPFAIKKDNIWAVPVLHYNVETAAEVCRVFMQWQPDCVAVELPETMEKELLAAAERLPDISVVISYSGEELSPLYFLCEPADAAFEGLRCAQEHGRAAFCIDLDIEGYPDIHEALPDPYAITRIGLEKYWRAYSQQAKPLRTDLDGLRELQMARRLKELSLLYERVLFVGGMAHIEAILKLLESTSFPIPTQAKRERVEVCTLTEPSCREVLPHGGYLSAAYEKERYYFLRGQTATFPPDRLAALFRLYRLAASGYSDKAGTPFPSYHMRNMMTFARNYAIVTERLTPTLFQLLIAARSCVDHNFAYEVWERATFYPHMRNIDNRLELDLSPEDLWGASQKIFFHLRQKNPKSSFGERWRKQKGDHRFRLQEGVPSFCSYQPEDIAVENFGSFLKKKGFQMLSEEGARTLPFTTSLEDGIDIRETLRHWYDNQLYVRTRGKPSGGVGSVVIIFESDEPTGEKDYHENYPWTATWHGEHHQESDMAFYATPYGKNITGPGICRCSYGGFMLTYPPRRVWDVWSDPEYAACQSKGEVLLMAGIDYSTAPTIVYVAAAPPRSLLKSYARRFGKKILYLPIGQLSPTTLTRLRVFHVLENRDRRTIADEYIF